MNFSSLQLVSVNKWSLGWVLALWLGLVMPASSFALITGGEGNEPLHDPGWPKGAAEVFNVQARVAYWEGPPFGGGQYTAECKGDTAAFNAVLVNFAQIDAKVKKLTIHDGIGASFWLNLNGEEAKRKQAEIDWTFTVWIPESWKRGQRYQRGGFQAKDDEPIDGEPVPELHLYTGGQVHWADVKVPTGITVVDERLEAHGHQLTDGTVVEGQVLDIDTDLPLAAHVEFQLIKPQDKGGYEYETVRQIETAADGKWVSKSTPPGWYQVVVSAPGYVTIMAQHMIVKEEPLWVGVNAALAKPGPISGIVVDGDGQPLAGATVRIDTLLTSKGQGYPALADEMLTDANGRFSTDQLPRGKARLWVHKEGYCRPGLGLPIDTPASDIQLEMQKSAALEIVVEFNKSPRPSGYVIMIEPEGGSVVGSWGGSGNIDPANQITFKNIPPGRYVLKSRPNPGSTNEETEPVTVELKGGETRPLTIEAK